MSKIVYGVRVPDHWEPIWEAEVYERAGEWRLGYKACLSDTEIMGPDRPLPSNKTIERVSIEHASHGYQPVNLPTLEERVRALEQGGNPT